MRLWSALLLIVALAAPAAAQQTSAPPAGGWPAGITPPVLIVPASAMNGAGTVAGNVTIGGTLILSGVFAPQASTNAGASTCYGWNGRSAICSPADGQLTTTNSAVTAGVGFDFTTDATWKCLTRAMAAGCTLQAQTVNATGTAVTAPTDSTAVQVGDLTRLRSSSTITPATAGVGNCGAAFQAAALTADCTIATLPAGMKLVGVYADVTAGFTCSGTCTGTKVFQCGTAVNGTQIFAAGLNVAAPGQFGLADADLGTGLVRAAAIQGGLIGSWSATTPVSCRFTSGTGNWGSGAATFVNAGSIKFTLITEQVK